MKKMRFVFAAFALSLAVAGFGQSAPDSLSGQQGQRYGRGRGPGMSPEAQLERMSQALNLTDDQKAKIKPILEDQSKQMHELMQDTSGSQEDKRAKFQQLHQSTMSQIRPLLNADQQKKLDSMQQRGFGRGEGHGQGRPNHDQSNP